MKQPRHSYVPLLDHQKITILEAIIEHKDLLFWKLTGTHTSDKRKHTLMNITNNLIAVGIEIPDPKYLKRPITDNFWTQTMKKLKQKRKTGSSHVPELSPMPPTGNIIVSDQTQRELLSASIGQRNTEKDNMDEYEPFMDGPPPPGTFYAKEFFDRNDIEHVLTECAVECKQSFTFWYDNLFLFT